MSKTEPTYSATDRSGTSKHRMSGFDMRAAIRWCDPFQAPNPGTEARRWQEG